MSSLMLAYLGQTPGAPETLSLTEICARYLPLLRAAMPKGVVLEAVLPDPGPAIYGAADQLQQLLVNLVTNAREAMGETGGSIQVNVKTVSRADVPVTHCFPPDWQPQDQAYACLEVTDTGCGIENGDIGKIFDPFFSSKLIGRGLGLAVVMGIVKAHTGVVTIKSRLNRGSTFQVFFPLVIPAVSLPTGQDVPSPEQNQTGTVLLVEDEEAIRNTTIEMLTHLGFTVLAARDGVEAVAVFTQHKDEISCVVCDLTMPHMDGWETLTSLRQLSPGVPVVLTSGYDEARVMAGAHPELPQSFLGKPFQLAALKNALAGAMVK